MKLILSKDRYNRIDFNVFAKRELYLYPAFKQI